VSFEPPERRAVAYQEQWDVARDHAPVGVPRDERGEAVPLHEVVELRDIGDRERGGCVHGVWG
jgi:hypothetical protein